MFNCNSCQTPIDTPQKSTAKQLNSKIQGSIQTVLIVAGVDCSEEIAATESALTSTGEVREVQVSIITGKATVSHSEKIDSQGLIAAIKKGGLDVQLVGDTREKLGKNRNLISVIISGLFTGFGLLLGWLSDPVSPLFKEILFSIAIIAGAWFIVPKALRTVMQRRFDMNILMTVAVIGAIIIGEWAEAAAVTFLFALSL
jgi:Cd2+/Zn2+-exporting ATPase